MFFRRPKKPVTIKAEVGNAWSFYIEAESDQAFNALSDWLGIMNNSNGGADASATRQPVGFSRGVPVLGVEAPTNPKQNND